jgi:hypothetical protein
MIFGLSWQVSQLLPVKEEFSMLFPDFFEKHTMPLSWRIGDFSGCGILWWF